MALSTSQMARMDRLLDEALALDAEGRRRWLHRLAPEHQDLEAALKRSLLPEEAGAAETDRLATLPKLDTGSTTTGTVGTLRPGDRVGPYELMREIGAGGMAEVWLAQRADGAFKREVALKLPMLTRLRKDLASRFARERDILASLEHPNIARLYDAGVSAEGLPYLAMEYVRGEPLTGWCDAHCLGVRERLNLFLQILDAVQYAHGHQVIHRDLKPSNILVTESGQVRLLDFGVAKLLAEPQDETQLTQLYGRALTPEYASPELVRGEAIEAASDIYSLGVVLYELLCGSRPYRLKAGASAGVLEQAIATVQVVRPSTQIGPEAGSTRGTTQGKLARRLRGDLDAIVLKALAKEPSERYGSAAELADELQRYLSGQPVEARPPRLSYRLTKFVLRHRTAVPVAAALMLLFAAMAYQLIRHEKLTAPPAPSAGSAPDQRLTAAGPVPVAADDKSIAVLPFVDMSEKHDQEYFSDGLSEELIDRLSHSQDLRVISRTSSFSFKGKQATVSDIASTLHVSHVLEGSVRKSGNALRITAQLIKAADGSHLWSQTYDRKLSDIFKLQGEISSTVAAAMKVALNQGSGGKPNYEPDTEAYNLLLQGNYFFNQRNKPDMERAIAYYEGAIARQSNYALAWVKLARTNIGQAAAAWVLVPVGTARARDALQHAISIDPNLAEAHRELAHIYMAFDWNWPQAEAEYAQALKLDPGNADTLIDMAEMKAYRFGRFDEAIALRRQAFLRDPLDTYSLSNLAYWLLYAGRLEESAAAYRKLIQLNPSYGSSGLNFGLALLLLGRYPEALAAMQNEPDEGYRLGALPIAYWAMGRRAESEETLRQLKQKYAAVDAYNIAAVHAWRGEADAAFEWLDRAYRQHDAGMSELRIDPLLQHLRGDARYRALLVKMSLTD
jgi:serine/threonine protein kinase/Flp pilus assembly protein TadD